jgi:enoyl-CoA hydratase/carnithine racemase
LLADEVLVPVDEGIETSKDAIEGIRAFAEKREPKWKGR